MDILPNAPVKVWGLPFEGFNLATLYNTWIVMAVLIVLSLLAVRHLNAVPGRLQAAFEVLTEFFENICNNTLGEEHGHKYMPFIATLFIFVLVSNLIGMLPNFLGSLGWPGFLCPTQDLNTPLGLALIVVFVVHISAIRVKGFRDWLWSFYEPSFPGHLGITKVLGAIMLGGGVLLNYVLLSKYVDAFPEMEIGGRAAAGLLLAMLVANTILVAVYSVQLGRVPNVAMAPLNFVGEIGKAISHPFRLFGNIFGGFVILTVASHLILHTAMPWYLEVTVKPLGNVVVAGLNLFFGLFIGLVHAFVFAMLALAYTAVQIRD